MGGPARTALLAALLGAGCAGAGGPGDAPDLSGVPDQGNGPGDLAGLDLVKIGDMAGGGPSCNPANETLGPAGGPDTCAYGEFCDDASSTCVAVPTGACNMIMGAPPWNKSAQMAPVIGRVSAVLLPATNATTECLNGDPAALVTVDYYAPNTLTSATAANSFLPQVKFKKSVVASDPWYSGTFIRAMPAASAKFGSFKVGINCGGAGGSVKTAGFYILDEGGRASNAVCVSW
jgi:hypothetical protein